MGIGLPELILILVIILIFVGPKKLPDAGAAIGKAMREFKNAFNGKKDDSDNSESKSDSVDSKDSAGEAVSEAAVKDEA